MGASIVSNSAATAAEMPEQFQCVLPKYRRIA